MVHTITMAYSFSISHRIWSTLSCILLTEKLDAWNQSLPLIEWLRFAVNMHHDIVK